MGLSCVHTLSKTEKTVTIKVEQETRQLTVFVLVLSKSGDPGAWVPTCETQEGVQWFLMLCVEGVECLVFIIIIHVYC